MAYERLPMRKIKDVLRLKQSGRGHGEIALGLVRKMHTYYHA